MSEPADPKIIVDSDWKSRVEAEKEELKKKEGHDVPPDGADELPPATFPILLSTLATQALVALGQVPDPLTGKPEQNLPIAKHFIDMIAMLEQKTAGNLDPSETKMLTEILHQLRMAYIGSRENPAEPAPAAGSIQMP